MFTKLTPEHYEEVAEVYTAAGSDPLWRIQVAFDVSDSTARRWVATARRLGLLGDAGYVCGLCRHWVWDVASHHCNSDPKALALIQAKVDEAAQPLIFMCLMYLTDPEGFEHAWKHGAA